MHRGDQAGIIATEAAGKTQDAEVVGRGLDNVEQLLAGVCF